MSWPDSTTIVLVSACHRVSYAERYSKSKYRTRLLEIVNKHESLFFNTRLGLNQGAYLTIAPLPLVSIWEEIYFQKTGNHLPLIDPNLPSPPSSSEQTGSHVGEMTVASKPSECLPYTKDDALKDLFMTAAQLDVILARLKRKQAIILQGPPGVGKTFIAHRLAFVLMGERDEHRVKMVQFHPSYGYEDFVQGYRPTRGGLERRDGVFHKFARLARNDPGRQWFFII